MTVTVTFDNAALFGPTGYVALMFASYMPITSDAGLYFYGIPSAGAPETWLRGDTPNPGGSFLHTAASPLPVDPAPAQNYGFATTYKGNLASVAYPRYTQPFYCDAQTATNTVWQMMFDRSWTVEDEIRFTQFKWNVKNGVGPPAWDWQYVVHYVVAGQTYGFRARASARPRLASGTIEAECAAEDAAWRATLQIGGQS
jgi:hypothetical protein